MGKRLGGIYIYSLARPCGRRFSRTARSPDIINELCILISCRKLVSGHYGGVKRERRSELSERSSCGRAAQMELTSPCLCRARLPSASNSLRTSFTFKLQSAREEDKQLQTEIHTVLKVLIQARNAGCTDRLQQTATSSKHEQE